MSIKLGAKFNQFNKLGTTKRRKQTSKGSESLDFVREFAPSCKASDAEATDQCFVPIAHSGEVLSGVRSTFLLCGNYGLAWYVRRVRFLVRVNRIEKDTTSVVSFPILVRMTRLDSRANCALGLPRSRTSTGSPLYTDSPSSPTTHTTQKYPRKIGGIFACE